MPPCGFWRWFVCDPLWFEQVFSVRVMLAVPSLCDILVLDRVTINATVGACVVLPNVAGLMALAVWSIALHFGVGSPSPDIREPRGVDASCWFGTLCFGVGGLRTDGQLNAVSGSDAGELSDDTLLHFIRWVAPFHTGLARQLLQ